MLIQVPPPSAFVLWPVMPMAGGACDRGRDGA
jgi:hypothetical protein